MSHAQRTFKVFFNNEVFVATVDIDYHIDYKHGADADGNRGIERRFIDDARIVCVRDEDMMVVYYINDELKEIILQKIDEEL